MRRTSLISLITLASSLVAAAGTDAHAAPAYTWGAIWQAKTVCPGTLTEVTNTTSEAGFYGDAAALYPRTGDVEYVRVLVKNIGCVNDGASTEFRLPPGARLAASTANPVACYWGTATSWGPLPTAYCAQAPAQGPNGGLLVAAATLPPGWFLDVFVPVIYEGELVGSAAGGAHDLEVIVQSTWGQMKPRVPAKVAYRAQVTNPALLSVSSTTAKLGFTLASYLKGGQIMVDFGTTAALGSSTPAAPWSAGHVSFGLDADLMQLAPSTQYFWRARFIASNGFTAATNVQSFVTAAAVPVPLSVGITGGGYGRVTSSPSGIDCGHGSSNQCSTSVLTGTVVRLTASATSVASVFAGWSGACTGLGTCEVTVSQAASVTATFLIFYPGDQVPLPRPPPRTR